MPRVNLLYVITKLELGGAQRQLFSLITHLNPVAFRIFLFTAQDGLLLPDFLSIRELTLKKSRFLERAINPLKDLFAFIELYLFIKKNHIDIVHTHSSKAGILGRLAAQLAKTKVILHTVHGWSFNDFQPHLVRRLFICLERWAAKFSHKIIVVSHCDRQKGLDNGIGSGTQYQIIRYGIEHTQFTGIKPLSKQELGVKADCLIVAMVACFKSQKSPQDFIHLASLVKERFSQVKFILVGDGSLRKKIEKLICAFNLKRDVVLTGWRRDIPGILSGIDVFVLTSLWEGLPIAALEAMTVAKPVIATHTGGIQEVIVDGKNGFLVAPKDIRAMSDKLLLLLWDDSLREKMGQEAKDSLSLDFTLNRMVENTENLYQELLKENRPAYAN